MKAIRYGLHFSALIVAALLYWWTESLDVRNDGAIYFHFGLTGALHATTIVVALEDRRARKPAAGFPASALSFITLATLLGAATPILGLLGSIVWWPITSLWPGLHNLIFILITGSAVGSAGYWALVRRFWMKSLGRADLLRAASFCVAATVLVVTFGEIGPKSVSRSGFLSSLFGLSLTAAWWFAFSVSLYWSETNITPRRKVGIAAIFLVIAMVPAGASLGLQRLDAPTEHDRVRLGALKSIAGTLHVDWENAQDKDLEWQAPASLKDIQRLPQGISIADPVTGVPYDYLPLSGTKYQLCAVFDHDSSGQVPVFTAKGWNFSRGRYCFAVDASMSPF